MKLALPQFQYRFVPALGNVIHPGNFHPVGTQVSARQLLARVPTAETTEPGLWLVVGGSGGFGSAARAVLGQGLGQDTINVSLDAEPNLESANKIRRIGSPGWHRNLAIERALRARGLVARSINGDAFSPTVRAQAITAIREHARGRISGLVWSLAAPRALDARTGRTVSSALKPLGRTVRLKTFTGADLRRGEQPSVAEIELGPGTPEEAIATVFVMGGGIVRQWIEALLAADALAPGFTLLTISYRGNALNADIYRDGLIGLAKADLEFETAALDHVLRERVGGRALAVEGPAVVTEASGGIPGVPFYMAHLLDLAGDRFEDPLASMQRLFAEKLDPNAPVVDEHGLVRMDDRELADDVQVPLQARYAAAHVGDPFDTTLYARFMSAYAATRGFDIEGVDYEAEFDTDEIASP